MQNRIPVVIDCDPGVDDTFALLLALSSPRLEVRAITSVSGNMPIELTTGNALRIVSFAGVQVPVSRGCSQPLYREAMSHSELFHGKNGLGNAELADTHRTVTGEIAVETLHRELVAADGQLQVIALGPLTNIAFLLKLYPEVKSKIAHLTIMGGSRNKGNITQHAEFNFYCDGEAADIVLRSGLPMTLVDLDGCESAMLTPQDAMEITAIPSRASDLVRQMWDFNLALAGRFGDGGFVVHDAIAVAAVIDPTLLRTVPCDVRVSTVDDDRYGKSLVTDNPQGTTQISEHTDRDSFLAFCRQTLESYPI